MKPFKYIIFIMLVFIITSFVSSDVIDKTDKGVRLIAEPILDSILEGFTTDDYTKYSRDFDDTLKESISEKKFHEVDRQITDSIGNYQTREYLGFLQKGKMTVVLWRGRFDNSDDDVLIKLVVSKRGNRYVVTSLWFQ